MILYPNYQRRIIVLVSLLLITSSTVAMISRTAKASPATEVAETEIEATVSAALSSLSSTSTLTSTVGGARIDLSLPVGDTDGPLATALDEVEQWLYVLGQNGDASSGGSVLTLVNLAEGRVQATVPLSVFFDFPYFSGNPAHLHLSGDRMRLYASGSRIDHDEPVLLVMNSNTAAGTFGEVLSMYPGVWSFDLDRGEDRLYTLDETHLRRLVGSTLAEEASVELPELPPDLFPKMVVNSLADRLYVTGVGSQSIFVYRTEDLQLVTELTLPGQVQQLINDPQQNRVYATFSAGDSNLAVAVIQSDNLANSWTTELGGFMVRNLTVSDGGGQFLLLTQTSSDTTTQLWTLDAETGQRLAMITIPPQTALSRGGDIAFTNQGNIYYLLETGLLTSIDPVSGQIGPTILLDVKPLVLTLGDSAERLYVIDSAGTIHVLDTASLTIQASWSNRLKIGLRPRGYTQLMVVDNWLFVSTAATDETLVLDATTGQELGVITKAANQIIFDPPRQRFLLFSQGIYFVDAITYQITGQVEDTIGQVVTHNQSPKPGAGYGWYDEQHSRLFVRVSNNMSSPASTRTTLRVYDSETMTQLDSNIQVTDQFLSVTQLPFSLAGLAVIPELEQVWVASRARTQANLTAFSLNGQVKFELWGLAGELFWDPLRQQLNVMAGNGLFTIDPARYEVLSYRPLTGSLTIAHFDPIHERLFYIADEFLHTIDLTASDPPTQPLERLPEQPIRQLAIDAEGTILATVNTDERSEVNLYRQMDDGWVGIQVGPPAKPLAHLVAAPDMAGLFFTTPGLGLLRSTDSGQTWQLAVQGLTDFDILDVVLSPQFSRDGTALLATGRGGLYQTTDRGQSWRRLADVEAKHLALATGLPGAAPTFLILALDEQKWNNAQVYGTDDISGRLEYRGSLPVPERDIRSRLSLSPNFATDGTALVGTDVTGLLMTEDFGRTWHSVQAFDVFAPSYTIAFSPDYATDRTVYVLVTETTSKITAETNSQLARSTDGGHTWQQATNISSPIFAMTMTQDGQLGAGDLKGRVAPVETDQLTWSPLD